MTAPLRDRFGVVNRLEYYDVNELEHIITRSASVLGADIDHEGALELARRSRGTPRLANRMLKRVRDFAQVKFNGAKEGLDKYYRNILNTIIEKYNCGPLGLETLAASLGEDAGTLEDVYEPYLIFNGFINRTPRGRVVTEYGYRHFGLPLPGQD